MCVSVSTRAHRLVHLCVQETRCGSLGRHHGLPLRWNSLSVSADARREALLGGDWRTAGQPQLDSQGRCSATRMLSYSIMSSLCDPMVRSPPGSSVRGISRAGILEWVAISFSRLSNMV